MYISIYTSNTSIYTLKFGIPPSTSLLFPNIVFVR